MRAVAARAAGAFMIIANRTTPFCVNAQGRARLPPRAGFEITVCDVKLSASVSVSSKAWTGLNFNGLRLTV